MTKGIDRREYEVFLGRLELLGIQTGLTKTRYSQAVGLPRFLLSDVERLASARHRPASRFLLYYKHIFQRLPQNMVPHYASGDFKLQNIWFFSVKILMWNISRVSEVEIHSVVLV